MISKHHNYFLLILAAKLRMRTVFLTLTLFTCHFLFAQTRFTSQILGSFEFYELDYGLAKVEEGISEKMENTPTKTHGWLKDFAIIKNTDSIVIEPKANFGVVYQIQAKDSVDINLDIEWIYPKTIKDEKGEKFKSVRYTTKRPTNTPSASSYSLDAPYEMVPGKWVVNLYLENKVIYSRTFILYKQNK
jgi:hypothetical protein